MSNTKKTSELFPETTRIGDLIAFTDKRGRACTAEVTNIQPGQIVTYLRSIEGVPSDVYIAGHPKMFGWADGRIRTPNELSRAQGKPALYEDDDGDDGEEFGGVLSCARCGDDFESEDPDPAEPYCSKRCWLEDGGNY